MQQCKNASMHNVMLPDSELLEIIIFVKVEDCASNVKFLNVIRIINNFYRFLKNITRTK